MDLGVSMCSKVWLPDTTWSPTQDLSLRTLEGQPLLRVGSDLRTVPLLGLQPSILGSAVDSFKNIFSHTFCFGAVTTGVPGR